MQIQLLELRTIASACELGKAEADSNAPRVTAGLQKKVWWRRGLIDHFWWYAENVSSMMDQQVCECFEPEAL